MARHDNVYGNLGTCSQPVLSGSIVMSQPSKTLHTIEALNRKYFRSFSNLSTFVVSYIHDCLTFRPIQ